MSDLKFTRGITEFKTQAFNVAVLPRYGTGVVTLSGAIEAGPWHGSAQKGPVAEVLASLLDEGTKKRTREDFRNTLEQKGTSLNFWADGRFVMFTLRATTLALPEALSLLFEALTEPALNDASRIQVVERESAARLQDSEDTRLLARHALTRALFTPNSAGYRFAPLDERAQTLSVTSNDIKEFFKKAYCGPMKIAVVGDIRPEDMEHLLLEAGKAWNHTSASVMRPVELEPQKDAVQKTFSSVPGKESVDVFMGSYVPLKSEDKETPAVLAALDLLGGGFSDHLMQTVRDRDGLTYGTLARIRGRESGNGFYWFAWAMFGNTLFKKGTETLEKEIQVFLNAGIPQKRYEEKIQELEGKLAVSFSSPLSAVSEIISGMLTTGNPSESDAFVTKLKALDAKTVESAARKYLKIDAISAAGAIDTNGNLL
ncbi:insulinase family protein [Patescibacteria group bacterium]|nr:insulinase family protein [Patescibacteria group bacterium]